MYVWSTGAKVRAGNVFVDQLNLSCVVCEACKSFVVIHCIMHGPFNKTLKPRVFLLAKESTVQH